MAASEIILGLDLGQASDFSALCLLQKVSGDVDGDNASKDADEITRWVREQHAKRATATAAKPATYGCRGLRRWALGTSYVCIADDVGRLIGERKLSGCDLVIDGTGVGRAVVDLFRDAKLPVKIHPVVITAGVSESQHGIYHHVAKVNLIGVVQRLLQERRL